MNAPVQTQLQDGPQIPSPLFDPIETLAGRSLLALKIGGLLAPVFFLLAITLVRPSYRTEALLNIEPYLPRILHQLDREKNLHSFEDWLRTQERVITSFPVLEESLRLHSERGGFFQGEDETTQAAIERLGARLKVVQQRDTQLISVALESRSAHGIDQLVNSVVESYVAFVTERQKQVDHYKLKFLLKERDDTELRLEESYHQLEEISQKHGAAVANEKNLFAYTDVMLEVKRAYNRTMVRRMELENELTALQKKNRRLRLANLAGLVDQRSATNEVVRKTNLSLSKEERDLRARLVRLGPAHPERAYLQEKLAGLQAHAREERAQVRAREATLFRRELTGRNDLKILDKRAEVEAARRTEHQVRAEMRKVEGKMLYYNSAVQRAATRRNRIAMLQERLARINRRIDEVQVELVIPGRVTVISPALPGSPNAGKRKKMAMVAVIGAFGIGFGIVLLLDLIDSRLRKPGHVYKALGFAACGATGVLPRTRGVLRDAAARRIALHLERERIRNGSRVFAFSGVTSGVGTSTMARIVTEHLDVSPARKLYLRFQSEHPEAARSALNMRALPAVDHEGFRRLELDDTGRDAALARNATALRAFLKKVRSRFDFIILDGLPLTEPEATRIDEAADVALVVARSGRTTVTELQESVSLLDRAGVATVGVLLNGVERGRGASLRALLGEARALLPRIPLVATITRRFARG